MKSAGHYKQKAKSNVDGGRWAAAIDFEKLIRKARRDAKQKHNKRKGRE